jgi:polar amino acid transport system substrate-binding protein
MAVKQICRLGLVVASLWFAAMPWHAAYAAGEAVPQFRQVSTADVSSSMRNVRRIRFALGDNQPPFVYRNEAGELTGFIPLLLGGVCSELKTRCEFLTRPAASVKKALDASEVDAVVSFVTPDSASAAAYGFTRPFLRSFSRFATRVGSPISETSRRALAGKRIGVRANTRQAQFLARHYPRSALVEFGSAAELYDALRLVRVDAIFEDSFRLMFWLQGNNAQGCCEFLGRGYGVGTDISQAMTLMMRKQDRDLRKVLDYGLDRLQSSGKFTTVYQRFFPASPY